MAVYQQPKDTTLGDILQGVASVIDAPNQARKKAKGELKEYLDMGVPIVGVAGKKGLLDYKFGKKLFSKAFGVNPRDLDEIIESGGVTEEPTAGVGGVTSRQAVRTRPTIQEAFSQAGVPLPATVSEQTAPDLAGMAATSLPQVGGTQLGKTLYAPEGTVNVPEYAGILAPEFEPMAGRRTPSEVYSTGEKLALQRMKGEAQVQYYRSIAGTKEKWNDQEIMAFAQKEAMKDPWFALMDETQKANKIMEIASGIKNAAGELQMYKLLTGGQTKAGAIKETRAAELPAGVTEADVQHTMKKHKMTRQQVLDKLRKR
jgi:hypothetical protein